MFTCLNANLYAIYIQFSRFLRNRRFAPKGFDPYIIVFSFYSAVSACIYAHAPSPRGMYHAVCVLRIFLTAA